MSEPKIAIVDENDVVIGAETRKIARQQGLRHRIVRIFISNAAGQILLQQRSLKLTDNPGKWDQSAGGHVDEGEDYQTAAIREVQEELGVTLVDLKMVGKIYIERPANDDFLRRFQTIYVAQYDGPLHPDKKEVAKVQWFSPNKIREWYDAKPQDFTKNFHKSFLLVEQSGLI